MPIAASAYWLAPVIKERFTMDSLALARSGSPSPSFVQKSYARIPQVLDVPNLIQLQTSSFQWFMGECLTSLFEEISPIQDFTGGRFELSFEGHEFQPPKFTEEECRARETTYSAPLYVTVRLLIKETGEMKEQRIFMGEVPMMTTQGTFIIDMIDPDANASVWRSVTQSKLKDETIRDQAALDAAAMRVLAGFPPGALPASP